MLSLLLPLLSFSLPFFLLLSLLAIYFRSNIGLHFIIVRVYIFYFHLLDYFVELEVESRGSQCLLVVPSKSSLCFRGQVVLPVRSNTHLTHMVVKTLRPCTAALWQIWLKAYYPNMVWWKKVKQKRKRKKRGRIHK